MCLALASQSAELLGSPISQTAVCPSTEVLSTGTYREALPTSVKPELLGSRTLASCLKMVSTVACRYLQDDICHHTESQSFQIPTSEICSDCLSSILLQNQGTKWTRNLVSLLSGQIVQWTVGPGSPRTNKTPSNLILPCTPQH